MTPTSRSTSTNQRSLQRLARFALLGAIAFGEAAFVSACGAQSSSNLSTDTGNPPAIEETALRVIKKDASSVIVSAEPGGVSPAGASVEVSNESSGDKASTKAKTDGSFEVTVPGNVTDSYTVKVTADGHSESLVLGPSEDPTTSLSGLVGHQYLLDSATRFTPVTGTQVQIQFSDTEFGLHAGCNSLGGDYSFCDGKLCIASFGTTDIGCQPDLQTQDTWLADFFTSKPELLRDGDQLTVKSSAATLLFLDREVANPDRPLTGRTWTVDTFISGGSASNRNLSMNPTLTFNDDGTFAVFSGCNNGSGMWTRDAAELTLSAVSSTERGCVDEGLAAAEADVQAVIKDGVLEVTIDAARLTLMRGDIGLAATTE
jgi:heat shock protein HslJ